MQKPEKIAAAAMTVLFGVAVYCFFALAYPYHLHFQEQYQLFESTWKYFVTVANAPGGLSDWIGRFLTQFFYYAPTGAALLAVLLCGVQLLCWTAGKSRNLPSYALCFAPPAFLLVFYCDENALVGGTVALMLSLGGICACMAVKKEKPRHVLEALLVPVLYLFCGPLAVVFVLGTAAREIKSTGLRSWLTILVMSILISASPILAAHLFPYPLERLYLGVHYYRYHNIVPAMLWAGGFFAVLSLTVSCLGKEKARKRNQLAFGSIVFAFVAVLGTTLALRAADKGKEDWMKYDFMVRMGMWNRLMMTADQRNPDNPKTVSCLNLALAKTGRMAESQFEYFQNGPEGLLPEFVGDFTNPVSTSEIFWHLGMVNTAQRYAFEAQEAIPDFQKSARLYKRLAETNIVNDDFSVARKYLKALQGTIFYRKWADETLYLLDSGRIFEKRPDLAKERELRLKEHDFLFSSTEMDSMLGLLRVENPENNMALDYLMSWCLLRKDLDRFVECIPMVTYPTMPKGYQEALLLRWVLTHDDFDGLPTYISVPNVQRVSRFISDAQAGKTEDWMRNNYGDTYWFYYYYRFRNAQE